MAQPLNNSIGSRSFLLNGFLSARLLFRLSLSDLVHEWILTICLMMAVAAVLSPLLVIFGLKYGTIETLRFRLVQDPRNREVIPLVSRSFGTDWFGEIEKREDISFIIPTTRQISASADISLKNQGQSASQRSLSVDIIPTGEGDRLLLENGSGIPSGKQCVLSYRAAEETGAQKGDTILFEATRMRGGKAESGKVELEVAGVVSPRATSIASVFVPLQILEAVERFKDGLAVSEYGWPGSIPKAYPQYDGLLILLQQELTRIQEFELINNTGFSEIERLTPEALWAQMGYKHPPDRIPYFVKTLRKPVGQESIDAIKYRLRGKNATLRPWVSEMPATLVDEAGKVIAELALKSPPASEHMSSGTSSSADNRVPRLVLIPAGLKIPGGPLQLRVTFDNRSLVFPVTIRQDELLGDHAIIPINLAGVLNLLRLREIRFEPESQEFVLSRRGYAGFRLYAREIEDVVNLREYFESQGVTVHTQAERIRDVLELDRYLTLIFWLIATIGIVGGIATLAASLYASVERKQQELSILRLLGLSGATLFQFPIFQGACIMLGGFALAVVFFQIVSRTINTLFKSHLQSQESLCYLDSSHMGWVMAGILCIAVFAGTVAAWRTTSIEPAEALRQE